VISPHRNPSGLRGCLKNRHSLTLPSFAEDEATVFDPSHPFINLIINDTHMKTPRICDTNRMRQPVVAIAVLTTAFAPLISQAEPARPAGEMTREQRVEWWREARFGMFIHWGLYAIPGGTWKDKVRDSGYSEWIMFDEKIPAKEYEQLAAKFNPVKFDAGE